MQVGRACTRKRSEKWMKQAGGYFALHVSVAHFTRDSRYFGHLLRNKSATRGAYGEGEPMPERRDEMMPEPGGHFELGGCLTSFVYDNYKSRQ